MNKKKKFHVINLYLKIPFISFFFLLIILLLLIPTIPYLFIISLIVRIYIFISFIITFNKKFKKTSFYIILDLRFINWLKFNDFIILIKTLFNNDDNILFIKLFFIKAFNTFFFKKINNFNYKPLKKVNIKLVFIEYNKLSFLITF